MESEAIRCLSNRCEVPKNQKINFEGRIYTEGLALLRNKKTGKLRFINQAKLTGIGLLD